MDRDAGLCRSRPCVAHLMWSVDGRKDFCVSLLQISAAVWLTEYAQLALNAPQLPSTPAIQTQALIGY